MAKVAIVACCPNALPNSLWKELEINVLFHPITLEGKEYFVGDTISPEDFLAKVKAAKGFPKTSSINVKRWTEIYRKLTREGKSIVAITMAGGMFSQPTVDAAKEAVKLVEGADVAVVNSMFVVHPLGLVVLEAARAAKEGKSKDEVAGIAQEVASKSTNILALPDLEYLHKGGRIGKGKVLLGSLMKVIPLVIMRPGTQMYEPLGRGRNMAQANQKIIETIKADMEKSGAKKIKTLIADVGDNPEATQSLKEALEKNLDCEEIIIGKPRCGIGHMGPGGWGIGYYLMK
jgi:DegV family protein with EDD domain